MRGIWCSIIRAVRRRAATIIANNLKEIYPLPELVQPSPPPLWERCAGSGSPRLWSWATTRQSGGRSVDQKQPGRGGQNLVISLTDYFDIPFLLPQPAAPGRWTWTGGMNIQARPELDAPSWSGP